MKKEFFTGLTAMVLAIGLALAGCESPTNGSNGGSGSNALPAATATTVEGIGKFFAEGYTIVYLVGEVTLGDGQTLAIPDSHSVIVTSTGDLNGRAVAADGRGKVTVAGGTLTLGTTSGKLRFLADSPFTFTGGTINGTGSIVIDDVGAAIALLGNDAFVTAAGSAQVGIGDNPPVAVDTTKVVSDAPESAGSEEIKTALGSKDVVIYTGAAGLTVANIGTSAITGGKALVTTNAGADIVVDGVTVLTVAGTLDVAGKVIVGASTTAGENVVLDNSLIVATGNASIVLTSADTDVEITANTSSGFTGDYVLARKASTIGVGLHLPAGTKISGNASADVITLKGGAVGSAAIGVASGDVLNIQAGSIVANGNASAGTAAITTFAAGTYTAGGASATLLKGTGVITINTTLTYSDPAAITTTAAGLDDTNLALLRGPVTYSGDAKAALSGTTITGAEVTASSTGLTGAVALAGTAKLIAGSTGIVTGAYEIGGTNAFIFGGGLTLPQGTELGGGGMNTSLKLGAALTLGNAVSLSVGTYTATGGDVTIAATTGAFTTIASTLVTTDGTITTTVAGLDQAALDNVRGGTVTYTDNAAAAISGATITGTEVTLNAVSAVSTTPGSTIAIAADGKLILGTNVSLVQTASATNDISLGVAGVIKGVAVTWAPGTVFDGSAGGSTPKVTVTEPPVLNASTGVLTVVKATLDASATTITVGDGTDDVALVNAILTSGPAGNSTGIILTASSATVAMGAAGSTNTSSITLKSGGGIGFKGSPAGVTFGTDLTFTGAVATAVGTDKFTATGQVIIAAGGSANVYSITGIAAGSTLAASADAVTRAVITTGGSAALTIKDATLDIGTGKLALVASTSLVLAVDAGADHTTASLVVKGVAGTGASTNAWITSGTTSSKGATAGGFAAAGGAGTAADIGYVGPTLDTDSGDGAGVVTYNNSNTAVAIAKPGATYSSVLSTKLTVTGGVATIAGVSTGAITAGTALLVVDKAD